jgi:O-antigen/teichoic acid export membrane protein
MKRLAVLLGSAGALAMAFTFGAAEGIVHLTYGEAYYGAINALRVLSLALPLFFINYVLTHQVIAWDGQRRYLAITCAALAANVVANVLLIRPYGMVGAAWATLLTELVVAAGCLTALRGPQGCQTATVSDCHSSQAAGAPITENAN